MSVPLRLRETGCSRSIGNALQRGTRLAGTRDGATACSSLRYQPGCAPGQWQRRQGAMWLGPGAAKAGCIQSAALGAVAHGSCSRERRRANRVDGCAGC